MSGRQSGVAHTPETDVARALYLPTLTSAAKCDDAVGKPLCRQLAGPVGMRFTNVGQTVTPDGAMGSRDLRGNASFGSTVGCVAPDVMERVWPAAAARIGHVLGTDGTTKGPRSAFPQVRDPLAGGGGGI